MLVYLITNLVNGKKYVGVTVRTLEERWREHISSRNKTRRWRIHDAIRKYGPESFTIEVLEECDSTTIFAREMYWIAHHNSFEEGYNLNPGGGGLIQHTERTKALLSEKSKHLWAQGRLRQGPHFKGKRHSEESKAKMSASGRANPNHPWRGKHLSAETKAKASATLTGRKRDPKFLSTYIIRTPTGDELTVCGLRDFCVDHNIGIGNLLHYGHTKGYSIISISPPKK